LQVGNSPLKEVVYDRNGATHEVSRADDSGAFQPIAMSRSRA
jgi:hypothetical protein